MRENKEAFMKALVYAMLCVAVVVAFSFSVFGQEADKEESEAKEAQAAQEAKKVEKPAKEMVSKNPMVVLHTNYGPITVELFQKEAPLSVENFLTYVKDGFYDDTIFHRVVKGFVLQAGGMAEIDGTLKQKEQRDPVKNEATNGLSNERGTLSMARTSAINSGTSHFFINLVDNTRLDHRGVDPANYGYAVFGKVADGMDVVDKIADVAVADKGQFKNVPAKPVIINKAQIVGMETKVEKKTEEKAEEKTEEKTDAAKDLKKEAKKAKEE
jgi:peptidyl-prolyl cis-trans isomerase B (cyclophilin B)